MFYATSAIAVDLEKDKMDANNQAIKDCLAASGYDGDVLIEGKNFDWGKAAGCYQDWKTGQLNEEYVRLKFFLQDNPWYTGRNWDWETQAKAGWNCIVYHATGEKICRKPTFVK